MKKNNKEQQQRRLFVYIGAVFVTLTVFTLTVVITSLQLRSEIRQQIINRDAEMMFLLSQTYSGAARLDLLRSMMSFWDENQAGGILATADSRLQGVVAVQIFDKDGNNQFSLPSSIIPSHLTENQLTLLRKLQPINRYYPSIWMDSLFNDSQLMFRTSPVSLLEITVPVIEKRRTAPESFIQYWIDGKSMSNELAELNHHIYLQMAIALGCGYVIILTVLIWAFRNIHSSFVQLKIRSEQLVKANRELVLAAKSSAIGSISAYLFHGLKSPLTGLQEFISSRSKQVQSENQEESEEWQSAHAATSKINHFIREIIQIIQEEDDPEGYELSLEELIGILLQKSQTLVEQKGINLTVQPIPVMTFSNRTGNLMVMILDNLLKNAVEATDNGKEVALEFKLQNDVCEILIRDQGSGLPDECLPNPFTPCISSKPQGNGIGLAVSYQLSKHIGAELTLKESKANGSLFSLKVKEGGAS